MGKPVKKPVIVKSKQEQATEDFLANLDNKAMNAGERLYGIDIVGFQDRRAAIAAKAIATDAVSTIFEKLSKSTWAKNHPLAFSDLQKMANSLTADLTLNAACILQKIN